MTDQATRKSPRYREFNHPLVMFAEAVIPGTGVSTPIATDALKTSRDMIIDYIAISEETFTQGIAGAGEVVIGNGQTYLHYIDINWGIVEGARWMPGNSVGRMEAFHNHVGDRSAGGIMAFANRLAAWGGLRWNFSEPWIYNPIDNVTVDMTMPATPTGQGVAANEPMQVTFGGVGRRTGLRRSYGIQGIVVPQTGVGLPPFAQAFSDNQRANNLGAEAFFMTDLSVVFTNRAAGGPAWNADLRLLNFMRMRVTPSIGDSWSYVPIPLAFYGVDMSPPCRVAYHRPEGGPIFLHAGRALTFDVVNNHPGGLPCNVQVALIGRIAPGVGSVE